MPDPNNELGQPVIYWRDTLVPMSKVHHFDPEGLTMKLFHRWYDGLRPVIRTLSQLQVDPKIVTRNKSRRLAAKWAAELASHLCLNPRIQRC